MKSTVSAGFGILSGTTQRRCAFTVVGSPQSIVGRISDADSEHVAGREVGVAVSASSMDGVVDFGSLKITNAVPNAVFGVDSGESRGDAAILARASPSSGSGSEPAVDHPTPSASADYADSLLTGLHVGVKETRPSFSLKSSGSTSFGVVVRLSLRLRLLLSALCFEWVSLTRAHVQFTSGSLVAGCSHTCGLSTSGSAFFCGSNFYGALGDGTAVDTRTPITGRTSLVSQLSSGSPVAAYYPTCGNGSDGLAFCWGSNVYGQFSDRTNAESYVFGANTVGAAFWSGSNGQLGYGTTGTSKLAPVAVISPTQTPSITSMFSPTISSTPTASSTPSPTTPTTPTLTSTPTTTTTQSQALSGASILGAAPPASESTTQPTSIGAVIGIIVLALSLVVTVLGIVSRTTVLRDVAFTPRRMRHHDLLEAAKQCWPFAAALYGACMLPEPGFLGDGATEGRALIAVERTILSHLGVSVCSMQRRCRWLLGPVDVGVIALLGA